MKKYVYIVYWFYDENDDEAQDHIIITPDLEAALQVKKEVIQDVQDSYTFDCWRRFDIIIGRLQFGESLSEMEYLKEHSETITAEVKTEFRFHPYSNI